MFVDIVFPKGNEAEIIAMAEKLGIGGLCLVYHCNKGEEAAKLAAGINKLQQGRESPKLFFGVETASKNLATVRNVADLIITKAEKGTQNVFDKTGPDIVYDFETNPDYRNAGLDSVSCKAAAKNEVMVGFSFFNLLTDRRSRLYRIVSQNIMLCRKYKVKAVFGSFATAPEQLRAPSDLRAVFSVLGMGTWQSKEASENTYHRILHNQKIRSGEIIGKGIRIIKDKP